MKIPEDSIIPDDKINHYLLKHLVKNDKSKYLVQGGFTQKNPTDLKLALLKHIQKYEAEKDSTNEYGEFYIVKGELEGVNGNFLKT